MKFFATFLAFAAVGACFAQTTLIPRGAIWRFNTSSSLPSDWHQLAFDDRTWLDAHAELGWGDGDEETIIPGAAENPPMTTYYRQTLPITNLNQISRLTLRVLADDGVAVRLNGIEVMRRNLPPGNLTAFTPATSNVESNESRFVQFGVPPFRLRNGTNVIAVEVHQHPQGLADSSFDLELIADLPAAAPVVSIITPTNDLLFLSGNLSLQASASDSEGHIIGVAFLTNGMTMGPVLGAEPYSVTWTNPAVGHYLIVARAIDNNFVSTDSEPVHVQVGLEAKPQLLRAPYVQLGTPTGMTLRWQTDWYADAVLRYGPALNQLTNDVTIRELRFENEVRMESLQPDTTYFYSITTSNSVLASGPQYHFRTSPTNARPIRIWVVGDSGTADQNAMDVRDAFGGTRWHSSTDLMLMLGDNSYGDGTPEAYTHAVFNMYEDLLRRVVVWPTLGNHDAGDDSPNGDPKVYLDSFTLPTLGEAGGVPSGTGLYYSFDYGHMHFICLDSFLSDNSTNGAMMRWLTADLAATDKEWIIVYWHHPIYSWGTHNSDEEYFSIDMRERLVPILEAYGVDLVLNGHSHNYERTFLLNGHYGPSQSLQPSMILDGGGGGRNGSPPYRKPAGGMGSGQGTVYVVCGCSGAGGIGEGYLRHPAVCVNHGGYGSMVIEVEGRKLTGHFLRPSGLVEDMFIIDKTGANTVRPELQVEQRNGEVMVSWPTSVPPFTLETAGSFPGGEWTPVETLAELWGQRFVVPVVPLETNQFFRLRAP